MHLTFVSSRIPLRTFSAPFLAERTFARRPRALPVAANARQSVQTRVVPTSPIPGQKTGTSGMRKTTAEVTNTPNFMANWFQSLLSALDPSKVAGSTVVLGGDGRYLNRVGAQLFIQIAAANGVGKVVVGQGALMSTPAVSALIRATNAFIGVIMTASHNPGGQDGDWGVKFNTSTGSPALENLTDAVYQETLKISQYNTTDIEVNLEECGAAEYPRPSGPPFVVEVVDPTENYTQMLRDVFDFDALRRLCSRPDFSFVFDAMHAVTGPYARRIFVDELGADESVLLNCEPSEDFGAGHPDPNLTYAAELVSRMDPVTNPNPPQFGAASDGDGDRNMILGQGCFVTPSDSVAIIADYAAKCLPYFNGGLKGLARSMPTSGALDRVARALDSPFYETPTGWKFFGNLMDAGRISICGEESFGTGSDHVREKDGIWAVLAWLSILAYRNADPSKPFVGVGKICEDHWRKYGRNYYSRYDYEKVDGGKANAMMDHLRAQVGTDPKPGVVERIDEFEYTDPVDGSVAGNQGLRIILSDGSRIVFRLSGTGSTGATIRVYLERYELSTASVLGPVNEAMTDLVTLALELSRLQFFTGRTNPTVIT